MILSSSPHTRRQPTSGTRDTRITCILSSLRLSRSLKRDLLQFGLADLEENALYSKAPDEDTLILSHGGILLSMELRKISMRAVPTKRSLNNRLARDDYCERIRVPECWTKQNSPRRY